MDTLLSFAVACVDWKKSVPYVYYIKTNAVRKELFFQFRPGTAHSGFGLGAKETKEQGFAGSEAPRQ